MGFSYKPLWRKLVDEELRKEDLRIGIKTTSTTIAKMSKDEYVSMKILDDICNFLKCKISDIVEHIPEK